MKSNDFQHILKWADRALSACFALSFLLIAILSARSSLLSFGKLILLTALPFFLVTFLRHFFAKKRPYQKNGGIAPRRGENDSFPSRHAFSAFLIAMTAFSVKSLFGYLLLPLAILLSVLRVLRGIHYPEDVVFGGFLGVFFGTICLVLL